MKWLLVIFMIGTFICMMIHVDDSDKRHGFGVKDEKGDKGESNNG